MNNELESAIYALYGANNRTQINRYQRAIEAFRSHFGQTDNIHIARAPGRVNLIGEHTDYNHGYVMPAALDKDVVILARPRTDGIIHLHNMEERFPPIVFPVAHDVPRAPAGDWGNYVRGTIQVFTQHMGTLPPGMDLLVLSASPFAVPRGAGLSSSTALTVAMAMTLCTVAGWRLTAEEMIRLCSDSEWYVGTRGGIMDQFASIFGQRGHALFLDCRPASGGYYHYQALPLPQGYQLLVVDSGVHHENARGEFNQRVAACRAAVGLLRRDYPGMTHLRDVQAVPWEQLDPSLPEVITTRQLQESGIHLGEIPGLVIDAPLRVRACARHVWTENQRVIHAVDALESNDIRGLGQLLIEAHQSARDDYAISCSEVEMLIASTQNVEGVYGARLTGAGWGGCIIALVHQDAVANFQRHVQESYLTQSGRTAAIFPCEAGSGAGAIGVFNF